MTTRTDTFIEAAIKTGVYSFDVEHPPNLSANDPDSFYLYGMSFATEGHTMYEKDMTEVKKIVQTLFPLDLEAIAYNGKYDIRCSVAAGLITNKQYPKKLVDPMIAVNLLDDNRLPSELGLKVVVYDMFGRDRITFEQAHAFGPDSDEFHTYACDDARDEFEVWKLLKPKLEAEGLLDLFMKILCPVSKVFADMESTGNFWDIKEAKKLLRGFQELRDRMEKEIFAEIGPINLGSGDKLAKRLFDELGFSTKGIEMTASGKRFAVDAAAMDTLAYKYPVCAKIRTFRTATKMINTYVEPLTRKAIEDKKGRVHPTVWLVSTTGRTRMENPNLQNIPAWLQEQEQFKGLNIRNAIVAEPGRSLVVSDLSQIELRLVAHFSEDKMFLKAYREWECTACKKKGSSNVILHQCPECGQAEDEVILKKKDVPGFWHGLDLHQMTTDTITALHGNRQNGKASNFALVYYATAYRMHYEYPDLSVDQWQDVIDEYFGYYSGVRVWHNRMERQMYSTGVARDIFGRKRRILKKYIQKNAKHALNSIINFGPQSSACTMFEGALLKMYDRMNEIGIWCSGAWLTNFVHDECVFEVDDDKLGVAMPIIQDCLENTYRLKVPVRTTMKVVPAWGEA